MPHWRHGCWPGYSLWTCGPGARPPFTRLPLLAWSYGAGSCWRSHLELCLNSILCEGGNGQWFACRERSVSLKRQVRKCLLLRCVISSSCACAKSRACVSSVVLWCWAASRNLGYLPPLRSLGSWWYSEYCYVMQGLIRISACHWSCTSTVVCSPSVLLPADIEVDVSSIHLSFLWRNPQSVESATKVIHYWLIKLKIFW